MSEKLPIGYQCKQCEKIHYPKHGRCISCKNTTFDEITLPSEGTLVTYTILKAPPSGIDKYTLNLGIINLGEVNYTGQIDIEDPKELKLGMKLKAYWEKVRVIDGKSVFGFIWKKV